MDTQDKLRLVMRNCQEVVTEAELRKLIEEKKHPVVYLGTAVTGRPHIGYYMWVIKLSDFLRAGFKVKLLLADLHGALDNTPWELLENRFKYYETVIPLMFKSIGTDISNFEIVKGSDLQMSKDYFFDLLKLSTYATMHDAKKASSEVVKQLDNPKLSGLIYPLMQALDEEYLSVDVQYGGVDQRKILMFAREYLPKVGYKSRVEVMTPMIPGLIGEKMSASVEDSKIDLLDAPDRVLAKLKKAYCPEASLEGNGVLAFTRYIIFTLKCDKGETFLIERPEKFGGNLNYSTYEDLEADYLAKNLHPMDLKNALGREINNLLMPLAKGFSGKEGLLKKAYP